MDVPVTELRAHLREWLARARDGEDVVVTERGQPVVRLVALDGHSTLERLTAEGVIARPARPNRPRVHGRKRPHPQRPVADRVSEQRR
jgi:prevent-host-death family protein